MNEEHSAAYQEYCETMALTFEELADSGVISRAPTAAEIEKLKPLLKTRIEADDWGFSTEELVTLLCSVSNIKNLDS